MESNEILNAVREDFFGIGNPVDEKVDFEIIDDEDRFMELFIELYSVNEKISSYLNTVKVINDMKSCFISVTFDGLTIYYREI